MTDGPGGETGTQLSRGLSLVRRLGGRDSPAVLELFDSLGERAFGEECVAVVYGNVYHRQGLSLHHRQLATIAVLTTQRYASSQLRFHVGGAINVGCSLGQVLGAVVEVAPLVGLPDTLDALAAVREVVGASDAPARPDASDQGQPGDLAPELAAAVADFGEVGARPWLDSATREIVAVAACTALGAVGTNLTTHVRRLLQAGGTRTAAVETVLHVAFYAGFPAALNGLTLLRDLFAEMDRVS